MTTSQIEALLTLASTLHFTKASQLLHTTQPNLSKIISNLEREVGFRLLDRGKRGVKLTPAGKLFCTEMEKMMAHYQEALHSSREVDRGICGSVDVGVMGAAVMKALPQIVGRFRQRHPDIQVNLVDCGSSSMEEALRENRVDVAFLPHWMLEKLPDVRHKLLFADSLCLVVHRDHPLAGRDLIDLAEAREESFVLLDPKLASFEGELFFSICAQQGVEPQVRYEANSFISLLLMVECGLGVSVLAEQMTRYATDRARFVRIKGYERHLRVCCAWHQEENPCVAYFLDVVEECMM